MSFQSPGRRSCIFVSHVSAARPAGRGVMFRPCAKSSMSSPIAVAVKAFETLASVKVV
jgi:hypothetical protein